MHASFVGAYQHRQGSESEEPHDNLKSLGEIIKCQHIVAPYIESIGSNKNR